jgi:Cu(I)/Ag(I) efflux system periplasmic protein CusF
MKTHVSALLVSLGVTLSLSVNANNHLAAQGSGPSTAKAVANPDTEMVAGVVRKVDRDAKKLTMRHGPIKNLDMPEMSMVFRVTDPKMLEGLKPDAKVRFRADRIDGQITVTHIEPTS